MPQRVVRSGSVSSTARAADIKVCAANVPRGERFVRIKLLSEASSLGEGIASGAVNLADEGKWGIAPFTSRHANDECAWHDVPDSA